MRPLKPKPLKLVLERVVFGLLITFGITLLGGLVFPAAYGQWRTRTEATVSAKLTSVEKRLTSTKRGYKTSTSATFVYEIDGQAYSGDRISIWRSTGQFFDSLDTAWRTGQSIKLFIDPIDPSYAVYDREYVLWPSAAAVLMSLVSCGMGIHGFRWRYQQNKKANKTLHPTAGNAPV